MTMDIYTDSRYTAVSPAEPGVYLCGGVPLDRPVLLGVSWGQPEGATLWGVGPLYRHDSVTELGRRWPYLRYARAGDLPDTDDLGRYSEQAPAEPGHYLLAAVGLVIPITLHLSIGKPAHLIASTLYGMAPLSVLASLHAQTGWLYLGPEDADLDVLAEALAAPARV